MEGGRQVISNSVACTRLTVTSTVVFITSNYQGNAEMMQVGIRSNPPRFRAQIFPSVGVQGGGNSVLWNALGFRE